MSNRRMIIIGASGTIGRFLWVKAKSAGKTVLATGHGRAGNGLLFFDMREASLTTLVGGIQESDTVYLLSAYSDPSWIFEHQAEAAELNLKASRRVIDEIAAACGRVIFMSSVEVFDGEKGRYTEEARPNPPNLYGRMKFEMEEYITKKHMRSCIVRTGWNVGWDMDSRCVVKLTYHSLLRPSARMAVDNVFSIIDARDTAEGLLRLFNHPHIGTCHLASDPPVVRSELADKIMAFSKHKERMAYAPTVFSQIPYSEKRGRLNHLDSSLAVGQLKMTFRPPEEIIREKVGLLDKHFQEAAGQLK